MLIILQAFFTAFGPAFQLGYRPNDPFESIELYNVLAGKHTTDYFYYFTG